MGETLNFASKSSAVYTRCGEKPDTRGGCDKPGKLLICLKKKAERDKNILPTEDKVDFYNPSRKVSVVFLWITTGDYIH